MIFFINFLESGFKYHHAISLFFSMLLPDTLGGLVVADGPGILPKLIIKKKKRDTVKFYNTIIR